MDLYWEQMARPWLAHEAAMEATLAPVGDALEAALAARPGEAILDIGPGGGTSLFRWSKAVGASGRVVGVDISPPMAKQAAQRTAHLGNVELQVADAGEAVVEAKAFGALASQLGMMFFPNPVSAFANLAKNLKPRGRMVFIAWGPRTDNPYFALSDHVVLKRFGPVDPVDPHAPGPFGLHDRDRTLKMMVEAGLQEVQAEEVSVDLTPLGDASVLAQTLIEIGPAARRLNETDANPATRKATADDLAAAYRPFETSGGLRIPAEMVLYSAMTASP
ncbi:MAG: methyltransferase domain-containing protein [Pseudomonadota bacterium]